jgi:hypothetical protein
MAVTVDSTVTTGFQTCSVSYQIRLAYFAAVLAPRGVGERLRKHQLKGLILAQNERWRRGLGMQVARDM